MFFNYFKYLRERKASSERATADSSLLSRIILRKIEAGNDHLQLRCLQQLCRYYDRELWLLPVPREDADVDASVAGASFLILRDGFDSWKVHFMDFVDRFRSTLDPRLIVLPPAKDLDARLTALIASIVLTLCEEVGSEAPPWARQVRFLPSPWFVAGIENLKALAIIHSPVHFRRNNIFVLDNILERA